MRTNSTTRKAKTKGSRKQLRKRQEHARDLVSQILVDDDDSQAAALMTLIYIVADEEDFIDRDCIAIEAMNHAYTLCPAFSNACEAFLTKAIGRRPWSKPKSRVTLAPSS